MSQLEQAGIPTVLLGTTAFVAAAAEQWLSLGFEQGPFVAVAHPLGVMPMERALDEAERALDRVLATITRAGSPAPSTEPGPEAGRPASSDSPPGGPTGRRSKLASPRPMPPPRGHPTCGHGDEEDT